jgi:hypothetical protein
MARFFRRGRIRRVVVGWLQRTGIISHSIGNMQAMTPASATRS